MQKPAIGQFKRLANEMDMSLMPLNGKVPIVPDWPQFCLRKRPFDERDFIGKNAGVCCGPASKLIVADVDDPPSFEIVAAANHWDVPSTFTVQSSQEKKHLYYRYPQNGKEYGNRSIKHPLNPKQSVLDVRGNGGQVVAPGSVHPDTKEPYRILNDVAIAPAPQWLLDLSLGGDVDTTCLVDDPIDTAPQDDRIDGTLSADPAPEIDDDLISSLGVSDQIKELIRNGRPKGQRSEPIMSVLKALVGAGTPEPTIFQIFDNYPIGAKYREKGNSKERWLKDEIRRALAHNKKTEKQFTWFPCTDTGNGERLANKYGAVIRYCHLWGKWLIWDGRRWLIDTSGKMKKLAKRTARGIYAEAEKIGDKDTREKVAKWAMSSESEFRKRAMIASAESEDNIPIDPEALDENPWLLNIESNTINLKGGTNGNS
jgi:hypothetical protein